LILIHIHQLPFAFLIVIEALRMALVSSALVGCGWFDRRGAMGLLRACCLASEMGGIAKGSRLLSVCLISHLVWLSGIGLVIIRTIKTFDILIRTNYLYVMGLCKECNKCISQPEGKRKKEFCNNTCRSNFWYGKNKKGKAKINMQDLTKPTNEIKPFEQPKTNYAVIVEPTDAQPIIGSFDGFKQKILATRTIPELETVMKEIKASLLSGREKMALEGIAKEHSRSMYTD
jgi:hypothetical protein